MLFTQLGVQPLEEDDDPPELLDEEPPEEVDVPQIGLAEPEETQETFSEQEFEFASGQQIVAPPARHFIHVPV